MSNLNPESTMKRLLILLPAILLPTLGVAQQTEWSWQNPLPQGNYLWGTVMINNQTVFAVGEVGTIIKSTDGGNTWSVQHVSQAGPTRRDLRSVDFGNGGLGVAVGDRGVIFRTTNAGDTWR